jgi:hypothetical protein
MQPKPKWVAQLFGAVGWTASMASWIGLSVSAIISTGLAIWAWATQWGLLATALVGLGAFTASIWSYNGIFREPSNKIRRLPTSAKISFSPSGSPSSVKTYNIRRWYTLNNCVLIHSEQGFEERGSHTIIFITFEYPINIMQIFVRFIGAHESRWELKDRDPYQVILVIEGRATNCVLEIEIEN